MCIVEALACGTPVIAPAVGWVSEFPHIEFEVGDAADLRRVLLTLLEEKRARRAAVADRGWDRWAEGHDRIFHALAREHGWTLAAPSARPVETALPSVGLCLHGNEGRSPGGPSVRVPRLGEELRERGWDTRLIRHPGVDLSDRDLVHVFNVWAPNSALDVIRRAKHAGKTVVFSPIFLDLSLRPLWDQRLPAIFDQARSDIELMRELERYRAAVGEGRERADRATEPQPGYHAAIREMVALSDHVILLSERERSRLMAIGADLSRGTVIHNPVDAELFADADPTLFEQTYGLRDFVLCVARQESRKNQLMLMQALAGMGIPLVLVGHPASAAYRAIMDRYRTDDVHLIERLPPNSPILASAYAAARCAVLPSWAEGAPLAALEAAASGTALVVSNESGEEEYFGALARYADPACVDSIRTAVVEAFETRRSSSEVAAQKTEIAERFSWDAHQRRTSEVYRKAYRPVLSDKTVAVPDESALDIVFDLTTTANHRGRWTGIARVETALALALADSARLASIRFVAWSNRAGAFFEIPIEAVRTRSVGALLTHFDKLGRVGALDLPRGARYVVPGSGWMQNARYAEGLVTFSHRHGMRLTPIIHDLIPVSFPFWFEDGYARVFEQNLSVLLGNAELIAAISQNTRRDVEAFANSVIDLIIPPVRVFREGDEIAQIAESDNTELPDEVRRLEDRPFVLAVGAIHQRKNYRLLHEVWAKLRDRIGGACPRLVIVGGVAWNGSDDARGLREDKRLSGLVDIVEHVSDRALEWLYCNCLFTVYPSLYEGWGLPVSESLRHGKICVASDTSSVPEIAPALVDLIDPHDVAKWLARVQHYATSATARDAREQVIRAQHTPLPWSVAADAFIDLLQEPVKDRPPRFYTFGSVASLGGRSNAARYKREGWGLTEDWGSWTIQPRARLAISPSEAFAEPALFMAEVRAASDRDAEVDVRVNGEIAGRWSVPKGTTGTRYVVISPESTIDRREVEIEFENRTLAKADGNGPLVGIGVGKFALAEMQGVSDCSRYLGVTERGPRHVALGRWYELAKHGVDRTMLVGGWTSHAAWGVYSGGTPRISLTIVEEPGADLEIELFVRAVATCDAPLDLVVLVNEQRNSEWRLDDDACRTLVIRVPARVRRGAKITIDLVAREPSSPHELGLGLCADKFGIGLFGLGVSSSAQSSERPQLRCEVGKDMAFSELEAIDRAAGALRDWHGAETDGAWSRLREARLPLVLDVQDCELPLVLFAELDAYLADGKAIELEFNLNGRRLGTVVVAAADRFTVNLPIPPGLIDTDGVVDLTITGPAVLSPFGDESENVDERLLGFKVARIGLREAAKTGASFATRVSERMYLGGERFAVE